MQHAIGERRGGSPNGSSGAAAPFVGDSCHLVLSGEEEGVGGGRWLDTEPPLSSATASAGSQQQQHHHHHNQHWWCHHGREKGESDLSNEHFIYRINHVQMNGWFSLLTVVAWLYVVLLVLIVGMQVFDHIHAKHHVILISYEIAYPMFLLVVSYRQLVRHFVVLAIAWLAVTALNVYFNATFISVLLNCSENVICSHDQLTYLWYLGLFLSLSVLDVLTLIIYIRVIPIVLHVEQYFHKHDIESYVRHLAFFTGQSHPHHIHNVYSKEQRHQGRSLPIGEDRRENDGGGGGYDVMVHTTHHTLKSVTLRVPTTRRHGS